MKCIARMVAIVALLAAVAGTQAAPNEGEANKRLEMPLLLTNLSQVGQRVSMDAANLVINAMGFLGVPYRRGGDSAQTGFDCSGFVRTVYEQTLGLLLPRNASQQAAATERIAKDDLQPGDLVFFNTMRRAFSHVGIYIGDDKFIHAPRPGAAVRVESMTAGYWRRRFDGARRVESAHPDIRSSAYLLQ